jgi:hypothetical protein
MMRSRHLRCELKSIQHFVRLIAIYAVFMHWYAPIDIGFDSILRKECTVQQGPAWTAFIRAYVIIYNVHRVKRLTCLSRSTINNSDCMNRAPVPPASRTAYARLRHLKIAWSVTSGTFWCMCSARHNSRATRRCDRLIHFDRDRIGRDRATCAIVCVVPCGG